jgi:membrane associated rhomboid family serine protease
MLTLSEPGSYTIYHEPESVIDGKLYASQNIDGLRVAVAEEGGEQVAVTTPTMTARYSIGGRSGVSVLAFEIARPGRSRLIAAYSGGRTEPAAVLTVGHGFFVKLLATILGAISAAAAGFVGGLVIALVTYFQRRRMRRAAAFGR